MDLNKSYFEIVALIFISISSIFIILKLMTFIINLKFKKSKKILTKYNSNKLNLSMISEKNSFRESKESTKYNRYKNISNKKEKNDKYKIVTEQLRYHYIKDDGLYAVKKRTLP